MTIELPKPIAVTPVPNVRYREFTKCGQKPLAGGQIWTYGANSTTPKVTYKDPYGMSPNTNPIILDAAGEADIYLNGTYRFVVKDRNGVVQKDISKIGSWYSGDLDDQLKSVNDLLKSSAQTLMQPLQDAIAAAAAAGAGAEGWTDVLVSTGISDLPNQNLLNNKTITTIESVADLANLAHQNGRTVYVKSYKAGLNTGGGNFQFDISLQSINDGGYIINGWKRQKEIEKLTVVDFGAIPDGVTDAMPAVIKMDAWQLSLNDKIGIKFPAGRFALSEWDNSLNQRWNFKVTGVGSQFGYMNNTILIPINPANTNVFKVKARWVEFGCINVEGGSNPATTARHFFKNTITAGQFVRVNCINFSDFGGKGFQFQDTLDCKIDQFYGQDCYDNLLFSMMSGDPNGAWTHSTAIELTNVNIQRHKGATADKCAVFLPRCTQSIMRNVWIEDSIYPMNIAEGEWVIESLNCERCTNPVYSQYAKLNINFKNVLTIFDPSKGEIGNYNGVIRPNWVTSDYEQGTTQIQPHTVDFNSALMTKFQNSRYRFSGNNEWVFLGTYKMQTVGDALEIEIIGLKQFDNIDSNILISSTTSRQARGRAVISIQNKDNNSGRCTWYAEGSSPITEVRIKTPYAADTDVYVKLAPYVNSAGLFHKTSSTNRIQSGTPFLFNPSLTKVSESIAISGSILVTSSFTVNNGTYGFGMDLTNGNLVLDTKITAPNKIPITVNGSTKYITLTDS